MPTRTWLPLTPSTVTVTESPIMSVSPTRLVKINMWGTPAPGLRPVLEERRRAAPSVMLQLNMIASDEPAVLYAKSNGEREGSGESRRHPAGHGGERRLQRGPVLATALGHVRAAAALAPDLGRDV